MLSQYILLRNNKQCGPYNAEDLLQHQLKPYDLVWIQGKSITWQTADTVKELKNIISSTTSPAVELSASIASLSDDRYASIPSLTSTRIYVQLPLMIDLSNIKDIAVNENAELTLQANHAAVNSYTLTTEKHNEINNYRSLEEIRNEYTSWLHQQTSSRKKSISYWPNLKYLYSSIASTLSLLWKQLKHNSHIENRVSLQPINNAKGVV